jgi:hypothetical protein
MTAGNVVSAACLDLESMQHRADDSGVEVIMTPLPGCGQPPRKGRGTPMASASGPPPG